MAVFEEKIPRKVCLDDTETLSATIENAQNINGHIPLQPSLCGVEPGEAVNETFKPVQLISFFSECLYQTLVNEYIIQVQRGLNHEKSWFVCKRYNDFVALHSILQTSGIALSLPPKKFIGNMERNFIAERQTALQNYLHIILMNPILASCLGVRKFLDPQNYAVSLQEQALQHVSMALRSEMNYELLKPVPEIGWRLRKHYFSVNAKSSPKSELLLQWVDYGPDKYLEEKELQNVMKYLIHINHPHIEKMDYVHFGDGGCFVIRQFYQCGSLRDLICCAKPKLSFLRKYGNPKHTKPLSESEISLYGHQILEALVFLHDKGIPYGNLHLGNVLLVDDKIRLLDIENSILGLPSFYRPFFIQHKKINTMESIDVYSFGHVLFEMAFGYPLQESVCNNLPSSCPTSLRPVLESILSSDCCKVGMPSLQELIQHPFFSSRPRTVTGKINFKFNGTLRESLKTAVQNIERRLKEEQKIVRHQKKILKMQEILSLDDKIKKRDCRKKRKRFKEQGTKNGDSINKSPPRSESPTSTSTATSAGTVTPPLAAPKNAASGSALEGRTALLDSICAFNKSALRHIPSTVKVTD